MLNRLIIKMFSKLMMLKYSNLRGKNLHFHGIASIGNGENLIIGDYVSINPQVYLQCNGGIKLGDRVTLSKGVTILTTGYDTNDWLHNASLNVKKHVIAEVSVGGGHGYALALPFAQVLTSETIV